MPPRPRRHLEEGFALVELLVAVAILSVLAVAVVLAVSAFTERSRETACRADLKILEDAVDSYRARTGYYPSNQGILVTILIKDQSTKWEYEPPDDLLDGTPTYSPTPECAP